MRDVVKFLIWLLIMVIAVVFSIWGSPSKKDRPKDKNNGANSEENGKSP